MKRRILLAALVAMLAIPAAALAAGGTTVTVRVEGLKRTLLPPKMIHTHSGWITKYGAPRGACSARSVQGALDVATHHRWRGSWSTAFQDYEITSILGETHPFSPPKYYWEIFTDNVSAFAGACDRKLKLHRGEQLLFAAVPQTGVAYVTALRAPRTASAGHRFTVKVVWFKGRQAKPLAGARVTGAGVHATTNRRGVATLTASHSGALVLHAEHKWSAATAYVRAAPVTVRVS